MLRKKIDFLMFKISVFKVKRSIWKVINHNLKTLKFCLRNIHKISTPTNDTQNEILSILVSLYDKTIKDINEVVDTHRKYIQHIKE